VPSAFERLCVRDLSHETGALRKVQRANLLPSENPRVNLRHYEDELNLAKLNAGDTHTFKTICGQYLKVRERQPRFSGRTTALGRNAQATPTFASGHALQNCLNEKEQYVD
jgi:hypothetical protein